MCAHSESSHARTLKALRKTATNFNVLLPHLSALCSSADINEKLAGVTGIDNLIADIPADDPSRAVRCAANVIRALPCADSGVMSLASKVYGA